MNYLPRMTHTVDGAWMDEERRRLQDMDEGVISVYARGRDYHKVMRQRLERLAKKIQQHVSALGYRVFTDSAPVLEVELGVQSGLGWRGKHTLLLSRDSGSMFFLGEIYVNIPLPPTPKQTPHCGSCNACIDVCPTGAIIQPYVLDARKCISYLTIEHPGPIPIELRSKMGNHIYGCDDCQTVCPWNKFAQSSEIDDFDVRAELGFEQKNSNNSDPDSRSRAKLIDYFSWTKEEFEHKTTGTAIRRIGHERWLRNVAVAMGNALAKEGQINEIKIKSPSNSSVETMQFDSIKQALQDKLNHPSPLVVEHVVWALEQTAKSDA
jgi:epoxyqueuosine reductase